MKKIIAAAIVTAFAAGCASPGGYQSSGYHERGYPQYASNYPARSYSNPPTSGTSPVLGQAAGAVAGGLLGAQVGKGNGQVAAAAVGVGVGAYAGGKMSDPCQPDFNMGHVIGGIAGGLLGAQVGKGNGRTAAAAVGAATGAVVGGNMGGTPSARCR